MRPLQTRTEALLSLSLVIPVYNEEETVFLFIDRISHVTS